MLEIGDVVRVHKKVWMSMFPKFSRRGFSREIPEGPVFWISPSGEHRVMIEGCGWQFKQADVDYLFSEIDVSEFN